jgi:hypothetical protein
MRAYRARQKERGEPDSSRRWHKMHKLEARAKRSQKVTYGDKLFRRLAAIAKRARYLDDVSFPGDMNIKLFRSRDDNVKQHEAFRLALRDTAEAIENALLNEDQFWSRSTDLRSTLVHCVMVMHDHRKFFGRAKIDDWQEYVYDEVYVGLNWAIIHSLRELPPQPDGHRLIGGMTSVVDGRANNRCSCGWSSKLQFSSAVASFLYHQHLEKAAKSLGQAAPR